MEALDCPPEAVRRSRSRSPDATSHEPPTTPAVVVAGCDETAITPTIDPHLDASCSACMAASRWIPHTCKKARGVNKRHSTPAADGRRTKRSSVYGTVTARSEYTHLTRPHMSDTEHARALAALRMVCGASRTARAARARARRRRASRSVSRSFFAATCGHFIRPAYVCV